MRTANRIAGAVLGLAVTALGLAVAIGVGLTLAGRGAWLPLNRWREGLAATTVGNPAVLWISAGVGLLGLIVLVLQARPWPPDQVVAAGLAGPPDGAGQPPDGLAPWLLPRRAVEHRVAAAAGGVAGVRRARATVRGRRNRWRLAVTVHSDPSSREAIDRAVRSELSHLGAAPAANDLKLRPLRT